MQSKCSWRLEKPGGNSGNLGERQVALCGVPQFVKLLSLISWKMGHAANKLLDWAKELVRQNVASVSLLVLNAYDKVEEDTDEIKMQTT